MAGLDALAELKDHGLARAAAVLSASAEHVKSYFLALRQELAWYLACLRLRAVLVGADQPTCLPQPRPLGTTGTVARGLYDPLLLINGDQTPTTSDLDADAASLVVITGPNQGGKSTFLRALGVAQLMMQSGMFVAAGSFSAEVADAVYTHFKREEDPSMTSGKFDEELARMSAVVGAARPGSLVLCNESFSATNEREAALVGGDVVEGLVEAGVRVRLVTHLFELAERLRREVEPAVFLRADRGEDGTRSHRIVAGEPLPTSYGADLYEEVFGERLPRLGRRRTDPVAG
jgi:DNA mismatch repair ATPase MutS